MKSTFHSAILALALSVSAAPLEKYSSAHKDVYSSTHSLTPRGPSGDDWYGEAYGPPVFFEDEPSTYKGPVHDNDGGADKSSPPSTSNMVGTSSVKPGAGTTSSAIPLFGDARTSNGGVTASSVSIKASSTKTTSTEHTRTSASSTHSSTPTQKSTTHKSSSHKSTTTNKSTNRKSSSRKSSSNKKSTPNPSFPTPNYKSYVAKSGTLQFGLQNPTCTYATLIFARGTTEKGNMGTCVGPQLASALREEIPSLTVQGVDYPADSAGNTEYGGSGGPYMAMLAREARRKCPGTKIVLAGYSQGARVLHGALGKSEAPFDGGDVGVVVSFGDPLNGKAGEESFRGVPKGDVLQVCGDSDERCQGGRVDLWVHGGHVSYGRTAEEVARWVRGRLE